MSDPKAIVLASLLVGAAGLWAVSQIWDLAHDSEPWNQTRGLARRLACWWRSL